MSDVSIRDLRNRGGEVVDRVARGESITITKSGRPVAELHPIARRAPRLMRSSGAGAIFRSSIPWP